MYATSGIQKDSVLRDANEQARMNALNDLRILELTSWEYSQECVEGKDKFGECQDSYIDFNEEANKQTTSILDIYP